jgi:large subunit ribosomal protein L18
MRRPKLAVFRSNKQIYAQIVEEETGNIVAAANSLKIKEKETKIAKAAKVGELVAKLALARKVKKVVFDRRGKKYHGRVKALAEAARSTGLEF